MKNSADRELAPIAELRLRQWARRHYVPVGVRCDEDWHPVVLDEMRRCDEERALTEVATSLPGFDIVTSSGIVPLEPSRHEGFRIDAAHEDVAAPRFAHPGLRHNAADAAEPTIPYYA
ncbi:hypothetical protein GC176_27900 [bacterium]|nr:hypothetical protein [bacterium]